MDVNGGQRPAQDLLQANDSLFLHPKTFVFSPIVKCLDNCIV